MENVSVLRVSSGRGAHRLTGKRGGVQSLVLLKTYLIIDLYTHTLCASVVSFINGGIVIVTVSETKLR